MELVETLRWTASISGMIAAAMIAAHLGARVTGWAFVLFCGSAMVWIAASLLDGNDPLAVQNVVLLGINLFGVYRYLWRKPKEQAAAAT
ncbi:hypothetical protein [Parasphingorhabdus sp.]|uniref:hypothetical protein n=1 Tax=Parasphingorhabdus sp. TaxID=2709688 RepID=UPI0030018621